jgi:adenylate cyclase
LYGTKEGEKAIFESRNAIALNPNYADAIAVLADALAYAGRTEEAIDCARSAMRLNPRHHAWYYFPLGKAYMESDRWGEAVEAFREGIAQNPNFIGFHLALAAIYAEWGKEKDARYEISEVLRISPRFSLELFRQMAPIRNPDDLDRMVGLLGKAGLS